MYYLGVVLPYLVVTFLQLVLRRGEQPLEPVNLQVVLIKNGMYFRVEKIADLVMR